MFSHVDAIDMNTHTDEVVVINHDEHFFGNLQSMTLFSDMCDETDTCVYVHIFFCLFSIKSKEENEESKRMTNEAQV